MTSIKNNALCVDGWLKSACTAEYEIFAYWCSNQFFWAYGAAQNMQSE